MRSIVRARVVGSGDLQREARELLAARTVSLERARQLQQSGSMLGLRRAERYLAHREARARELGFDDLATYYRQRYGDDRRLDELAGELRCSESAVRGDLRRLGLGPDRSRSHGARWRSGA
jgi:hypothetical protein